MGMPAARSERSARIAKRVDSKRTTLSITTDPPSIAPESCKRHPTGHLRLHPRGSLRDAKFSAKLSGAMRRVIARVLQGIASSTSGRAAGRARARSGDHSTRSDTAVYREDARDVTGNCPISPFSAGRQTCRASSHGPTRKAPTVTILERVRVLSHGRSRRRGQCPNADYSMPTILNFRKGAYAAPDNARMSTQQLSAGRHLQRKRPRRTT